MNHPDATIEAWIEQCLAQTAPRSKSLVVTIFGDAIAPRGGAVWLGGLIRVLAPFGVNDRLARTSMFRLTEDGWFESRRQGRRSLYALTAQGLRRFAHASRRIYRAPDTDWDGTWTLVLFPHAPGNAAERAELRKDLKWEGFGPVAPGLFARPAVHDEAVLADILHGLGLQGTVFALRASDLRAVAARPVRELVAECWDLADLAGDYLRFIERFGPMRARLRAGHAPDARQAFQVRTLLVHEYRRMILHDPQFPAELLPADWPGLAAYALAREIYAALLAPSEAYLEASLEGRHGPLPAAPSALLERFGGIAMPPLQAGGAAPPNTARPADLAA